MITNIDENFGQLRSFLADRGLADDTILLFMTDNGTSGGWNERTGHGYNAGMRGIKCSYYDGGHRVPFFLRWADGGLVDTDIPDLVEHVDLL
jgi:arylsulfatase A-like enzyme